ncbi:putative cadmium-transporting ATPase [Lentilactobacillus parabuchneri]|nr:heavy metal translocating P-type ATPase [Lentilactobacillus parabuchneri]MBW0222570.1 heavy metal translocating P-type ATPase [Lentilactobacillus parabuchneri]MBW0245842.1 heavy metal translocating P-type ATPase [Lentilactobacillus parabuchneri]MCT2884686.1 copper-translocating P-type ATPase [Lentilactobacillus parabuchneri]MDG9736351.1 heavy metal translocating P-type ATPase [Lentilactobacillus parabuchneri]OBU97030.1 copper-translocating P-type ATPase [Lentilactobacillus parabuchneri]
MKFQKYINQHTNQITLVTAILIGVGLLGKVLNSDMIYTVSFIAASIISAVPIILRAISALRFKTISIELLVSIAVIGAFAIGEYNESAIVTFLFLFGTFLEDKTLAKTRHSIKDLTEMAPTTALVVDDDGETEETDVDFVDVDDVVLVKAGGQIPVDGEIVDGSGHINEASITGESKLVTKNVGDQVFSGTMLDNGTVKVRATKVGDDTTFGKIVELVEDAQDTKSPAEKFIDKFATYYTPAVLIIALIVGLVTKDFRLAITVLVLGCPGALVIGAPVSNVAGIGNGAKNGVLIKGGEVMNTFANVDTLVFDKTGTLTEGKTAVTQLKDYSKNQLGLTIAAAIEKQSDHPLAQAVVKFSADHKIGFDKVEVTDADTIKGRGVKATADGQSVLIGNLRLMNDEEIALTDQQKSDLEAIQSQGSSTVIVAFDGRVQTILGISDVIRQGVKESLATLKSLGIKKTVMLTGDNLQTADAVADQIGIDEVHAELLPEQKVEYVKKYQEQGHKVAFVGDGINDSPSLVTADIGIAMGSGTDVAVETSDVVLMSSGFNELIHAYGLSKKTVMNTKENIFIAIATVAALLIGLILGFIYMASGMFVHEASILVVIFNAMRLINYRPKVAKLDPDQLSVREYDLSLKQ